MMSSETRIPIGQVVLGGHNKKNGEERKILILMVKDQLFNENDSHHLVE